MKNVSSSLPWAKIDSFIGNYSSPTLTSYRPCPICGCLQCRSLLVFDDFQFFSDSAEHPKRAQLREVQCLNCHAIYLNPCYTSIGFNYLFAEAGQSYGSTEGRPKEQVNWLANRGLLNEGKVFLDVGCYDGRFLSYLPNNIHRLGVDIDAPAIFRGQERYGADGVQLIHGAFENFQCPLEPDVIVMFHVLEHLANPLEVLRHFHTISHDETRLIVEVPVIESGKTNDINGFLSVQHMTHFSVHSLAELMAQAGWELLERQQMPDYNGHRILAKPAKLTRKVVGDISDRTKAYEYFEHWYRTLAEVARKIETWPKHPRRVIWGGGMHSEFLYHVTSLFQYSPQCEYLVVDSDGLKLGKTWRGLTILSPDILKEVNWDDCQLVISSYGSQEAIANAALNLNVPNSKISRLYDFVKVY